MEKESKLQKFDRNKYFDILSSCHAFSTLPPLVLELLASRMEERRYRPGEYLMRQGDPGDGLLVIAEGIAEVVVTDPRGERIVLSRAGPGEIVGEMALLTEERRTTDVVAVGDLKALVLKAKDFHSLAARVPIVNVLLSNLAAKRLGSSEFDALRGKMLHGYRIIQCVGRGGTAIVYEALKSGEKKPVALKMLSHSFVYDTKAFARFQREAGILSSLRHENICNLFETFAAYGTYFLAMEFLEGPSLDRLLRKAGPIGEENVRKIVGQIGKALSYVHSKGIIHRNVKPSNVLFTKLGIAKLSDFGIAKTRLDLGLATKGPLIGAPRYMAPEQLGGKDIDQRADIYSLGCLAYALLTGREPFGGEDFGEVLYQKLTWRLPSRRRIGKDISIELYDFLHASLQREPSKRKVNLSKIANWASPLDLNLLKV